MHGCQGRLAAQQAWECQADKVTDNVISYKGNICYSHMMADISGMVDRLIHKYRKNWTHRRNKPYHPYQQTERKQRQPEPPLPPVVAAAIANAWVPATKKRYEGGVQEFKCFCDSQKVAEEDRLPAGELLLATFAASLMGKCAGATIQNKMAAIKAWHISNNVPWKGDILLSYILKGLERAKPEKSKQTRRPPVTSTMLEQWYQGLDHDDPRDVAIYAVATTAFYGQLRLGKICAKREAFSMYNPKTHSMRKDLCPPHTEGGSRILIIPWTKVKRTRGKEVAITRQQGRTDPIVALDRHLRINEITDPKMALISYITTTGELKLLTTSKFMDRCNEIWMQHGHQRFTGHSFRTGGTTHYLLNKINPDMVHALGHWSSSAFLHYWRQLDVLATVHTELMHAHSVDQMGSC
jgi:hypothetical protein